MHNRTRLIVIIAALALAAAAGVAGYRYYTARGEAPHAHATAAEVWTCPMHPEIQEPRPGKCPKCGMDLIKSQPPDPNSQQGEVGAAGGTPRAPIELDARRRQMLGVRTITVERGPIEREIRAVGVVRYDETRLSEVNLKLDGWIAKLHVDSTGQAIRRGQPLLDLYSPELVATGQEYLLALSTREAMQGSQVADARTQADRLVDSARQRLLLWDLPPESIERIERTRKADGTVTFRSPVSGVVIEKPVVEGMRAAAGQTLYRVADLSRVWVEADVHESDAPFVKTGAGAVVTLDAWPGERLQGRAVYIYPFVEEKTRTLRVRFDFPNPRQRLKPGMYANVEFSASLGTGVLIPADALLDAGHERVVFVAEGDGYYEPRQVQIGHRVGDRVQVIEGLSAGERVASGAAFFLDSESQLRAASGGWDATPAEAPPAGRTDAPVITFSTTPDPPRSGENSFEVSVRDASGQPVTDAQVRVVLYMPAMPSMNMPAMSSEAKPAHVDAGVYRGTGMVSMSGRWDVTVTVTRNGARIGTKQATVVAK